MTNILVLREYLKGIYRKYEIYIHARGKIPSVVHYTDTDQQKTGLYEQTEWDIHCSDSSAFMLFLTDEFYGFYCSSVYFAAFVCVFHGMCDCCAGTVSCDVSAVFQVFVQGYGSGAIDTDLLFHEHSVCDASGGRADGYPASAVSVAAAWLFTAFCSISDSVATLNSMDAENAMQKYRYIVDGLVNNKTMLVMMVAFAITVLVVYLLRRMSINHSRRLRLWEEH